MLYPVEIENPVRNTSDPMYVRYSHVSVTRPFIREAFTSFLQTHKLSPETHPRILDLCAGDGGLARMAADMGWTDITCIDKFLPADSLVPTATWLTWNLYNLYTNIRFDDMDASTLPYRNIFDLVLMANSELGNIDIEMTVCSFFVNQNGQIYLS